MQQEGQKAELASVVGAHIGHILATQEPQLAQDVIVRIHGVCA
jgi:hypothetical protein